MSASFLTNYFYDLPEDLQQTIIWYNAARIIIFRNIVGWTIRKQAFNTSFYSKLAEDLLGCPIGYTSVAFWGGYIGENDYEKYHRMTYVDSNDYREQFMKKSARLCFTFKSDGRWSKRTFEVEPFVTNDARNLKKIFYFTDAIVSPHHLNAP
jgi:hypothetical protein